MTEKVYANDLIFIDHLVLEFSHGEGILLMIELLTDKTSLMIKTKS